MIRTTGASFPTFLPSAPICDICGHNSIDALAVRWYDANTDGVLTGTNDGAHYYLQDANFNVTAVVNASGGVLERYHYTPYGEVTFLTPTFGSRTASTIANNHLYTGRERDPETGLQLNRHRYYAAHLGRWLNRDPIGYDAGDMNLYGYVLGMPLELVDPSGLRGAGDPGPCTIHIFIGHCNLGGKAPAIDDWFDNIFTPRPDGENGFYPVQPGANDCSEYAGALTCFGDDEEVAPQPPSHAIIPNCPSFRGGFDAIKAGRAARRARAAARDLGERLCRQREDLPPERGPENYRCGEDNMTCDTVTIVFTCGPDARRLFETGEGPSFPPGGPGKPGVLPKREREGLEGICDTRITLNCLEKRRERDWKDNPVRPAK